MSVDIMTLVWKNAPFQGNTLLTLLALADWSNDEGVSWPSVATLAKKSRQSERNCRYSLRSLEAAGLVSVIPGDKKSETYQINISALSGNLCPPAKKSNRGGKREQNLGKSLPPKVSSFAPNTSIDTSVDTPETPSPSANAAKTSLHHQLEMLIKDVYKSRNPDLPSCPWSGAEGKLLKSLLEKTPGWTLDQYHRCLNNLYATEGFVASTPPLEYVNWLPKYYAGPLNRFKASKQGQPQSSSRMLSPAEKTKRQLESA